MIYVHTCSFVQYLKVCGQALHYRICGPVNTYQLLMKMQCHESVVIINTLRPRQNGRHFADDILKCIFLNENVWIPIEISLKFIPQGPINNIPALVQIMAWRRPGDKPLSGPMMVRWLDYRRIYASPGLNELITWLGADIQGSLLLTKIGGMGKWSLPLFGWYIITRNAKSTLEIRSVVIHMASL